MFLLVFSLNAYSATKTIECSELLCQPDFIPIKQNEKLYYSSIDIGSNIDDVNLKVLSTSEPRSVRLSVENNTDMGKNLTVSLTPNSDKSNAGDLLILGDYFNNVNINLNGYNGVSGKNSSKMCYEEYEKGSNGLFGSDLLSTYNNQRFLNPSLPKQECVSLDVDNLLNKFTCDEGYTETSDSNNPSVLVSRLKGKNRCLGVGTVNVCLSKTIKLECNYRIKYTYPLNLAGLYDDSNAKKETRILYLPELEYESNKHDANYRQYICNNLSYLEGTTKPSDIVQNGEFYFNTAGWTNQYAVWDTSESIRLLPDLSTRNKQPISQQILNTITGESYRVQVLWKKDPNNVNVDSANISLFSDINKTNLIKSEKIYEIGSFKPYLLTIDTAPYDFGMRQNLTTTVQSFEIKNKDSRIVRNCSVVYMQGDVSNFQIENDTCGTSNMNPGASCSVNIRALPTGYGKKEVFLKRDCEDEYGNSSSTLNEKLSMVVYQNYIQPLSSTNPQPTPDPSKKFIDGFYWKYDSLTNTWQKCEEDYANLKFCFESTPTEENSIIFEKGKWFRGYYPEHMTYTPNQIIPTVVNYEFVKKTEILSQNKIDSKNIDFIFKATSTNTVLELKTLLPEHGALFDKIIVTHLSSTAGPSIKPPADLQCPTPSVQGCVSGSSGHGYYDLESINTELTSPGHDTTHFTVPATSDWRIRFVGLNESCPSYFTKVKDNFNANRFGYDENDILCDDIFLPEDPSSKHMRWQYINFERRPEFGTELIQCSSNNCIISYTVEDMVKNLVTFNLGSGTNGSQQGAGVLFIYDIKNITASSLNGSGGSIGLNNLPSRSERRACAKISDATTAGVDSSWAINPKVNFIKYNWIPLNIIEEGNYGRTPVDNGKKIKYYKKIDSSVRYLLKNEIF